MCVQGPKGLQSATWTQAMDRIKEAMSGIEGSEMKAIAGKLADAESIIALKDMMNKYEGLGGCSAQVLLVNTSVLFVLLWYDGPGWLST